MKRIFKTLPEKVKLFEFKLEKSEENPECSRLAFYADGEIFFWTYWAANPGADKIRPYVKEMSDFYDFRLNLKSNSLKDWCGEYGYK